MKNLLAKNCADCAKATAPLDPAQIRDFQEELGHHWEVKDNHHLEKTWRFKNFAEALAFTNRVGQLADAQGHHPDIYLTWGKVRLQVWTHSVDGLTESDFVLAAKIEDLSD